VRTCRCGNNLMLAGLIKLFFPDNRFPRRVDRNGPCVVPVRRHEPDPRPLRGEPLYGRAKKEEDRNRWRNGDLV